MYKCIFEVTLTFQAPILTHTADTIGFGFDTATRKYQNKPVLSGSLVCGNILHNLQYFSESLSNENAIHPLTIDNINYWFGQRSNNGTEPNRAALNFDYFWKFDKNSVDYSEDDSHTRNRIGINDDTGTVEHGNLQIIENCFTTGQKPDFKGNITVHLNREEESKHLQFWLKKALQYTAAMGALKGVGYGKLLNSKITPILPDMTSCQSHDLPEQANCIEIELTLDRPLCVARPHLPNSNRFISEDYISGSILKGTLARQLTFLKPDDTIEKQDLTNLCFTHALPCNPNKPGRTLPIPLSLTTVDEQVIDMATQPNYCLLLKKNGDMEEYLAPAFSPNWKKKDEDLVYDRLNEIKYNPVINTTRLLTVRTAIDRSTNVAAKSQLFSLECIDNHMEHNQNGNNKMHWRSSIRLDNIDDKKKDTVTKKLTEMFAMYGLSDIGKTKAIAKVHVTSITRKNYSKKHELEPINGHYYIIMLRTKARILSCKHNIPPTNGQQQLHNEYNKYFNYISNGKLKLSHYYSQQRLYGGEYYRQYFRKNTADYRPEWLSLPGSVFTLTANTANQDEIKKLLTNWLETGLPVAEDRKSDNWETDPLIPQNGFGEILINHPVHTQLQKPEFGELI